MGVYIMGSPWIDGHPRTCFAQPGINGNSGARLTWRVAGSNGRLLLEFEATDTVEEDGLLVSSVSSAEFVGEERLLFTCLASNLAGETKAEVEIFRPDPPEELEIEGQQLVIPGDQEDYLCRPL